MAEHKQTGMTLASSLEASHHYKTQLLQIKNINMNSEVHIYDTQYY